MIYLTGASNPAVRAVARRAGIGVLVTPATRSLAKHVSSHAAWAIDNGIFGLARRGGAEGFDTDGYLKWLDTLPRTALFATAPDVLRFEDGKPIGDAAATLERSRPVFPRIRVLGFKAALVAQDGLEDLDVPWDEFDALFIGGSDAWKCSLAARVLVREAKRRGKHVHMGRVNTRGRLQCRGCHGMRHGGRYVSGLRAHRQPAAARAVDVPAGARIGTRLIFFDCRVQ